MRKLLLSAAMALVVGGISTPASSATIVLNNLGGVDPGSQALFGFTAAAEFWSKRLTNDVTINLDVRFQSLGPGVLGQAGSRSFVVDTETIQNQLAAVGATSLDAIAVANLPTLTPGDYGVGALSVITPGDLGGGLGSDALTRVLDADGSANNSFLDANSANLKALGFTGFGDVADGAISFSSDFNFDFDPSNGIANNAIDFISVAVHEIGHVLGFVSGVDIYDVLGFPDGPLLGDPDLGMLPLDDFAIGSVLDLYRYSAADSGAVLDWSVGGSPFFSIDGQTVYGGGYFSTGAYNGDGRQASHWKDNLVGMPQLGALDPTVSYGQAGKVTSLDLAAFDVIGWNIDYDVLNSTRSFTTRDIYYAAIPEPTTWALTITGFFLIGGALRRTRRIPAFARI